MLEENRSRDRTPEEGPLIPDPFPLHAVLDNVRSAFNVGSIFRTAEAARLQHLHLCGITARPPHERLEKTALGTSFRVPWSHHIHTRDAVQSLQASGVQVVALEVQEGATALYELDLKSPLALVFGHEVAGVDPQVLDAVDVVASLPMRGRKNSLNVAVSFGIAVFETLRRWEAAGS